MKEELKHIFQNSACLSEAQLIDYTQGKLSREEDYAVEMHLSSCDLCSDAVDGYFLMRNEKLHPQKLDLSTPHISTNHFEKNSDRPLFAEQAPSSASNEIQSQPAKNVWLKRASLAAILILSCGLVWYGYDQMGNQADDHLTQLNDPAVPQDGGHVIVKTESISTEKIPATKKENPSPSKNKSQSVEQKTEQMTPSASATEDMEEIAQTESNDAGQGVTDNLIEPTLPDLNKEKKAQVQSSYAEVARKGNSFEPNQEFFELDSKKKEQATDQKFAPTKSTRTDDNNKTMSQADLAAPSPNSPDKKLSDEEKLIQQSMDFLNDKKYDRSMATITPLLSSKNKNHLHAAKQIMALNYIRMSDHDAAMTYIQFLIDHQGPYTEWAKQIKKELAAQEAK